MAWRTTTPPFGRRAASASSGEDLRATIADRTRVLAGAPLWRGGPNEAGGGRGTVGLRPPWRLALLGLQRLERGRGRIRRGRVLALDEVVDLLAVHRHRG